MCSHFKDNDKKQQPPSFFFFPLANDCKVTLTTHIHIVSSLIKISPISLYNSMAQNGKILKLFTFCHFTWNCYSVTCMYMNIQSTLESANLPACIELLCFPSRYIIFHTILKQHQHLQDAAVYIHISSEVKIKINGNE